MHFDIRPDASTLDADEEEEFWEEAEPVETKSDNDFEETPAKKPRGAEQAETVSDNDPEQFFGPPVRLLRQEAVQFEKQLLLLRKSLTFFASQMDHMRLTSNDLYNAIDGVSKENLNAIDGISKENLKLREDNIGLMKEVEDRDFALLELHETNDQLMKEIVTLRGRQPPRPSASVKKARPSCAGKGTDASSSVKEKSGEDKEESGEDRPEETGEDEEVPIEEKVYWLLAENLGLMKDVEDRASSLRKWYETNDQLKKDIITFPGPQPPRQPPPAHLWHMVQKQSRRRAQPGDVEEPEPKKARPSCAGKGTDAASSVKEESGEDKPEKTGEDEQVPIEENAWVENSSMVRAREKELVSQANELKRKLDQVSCGNGQANELKRKLDGWYEETRRIMKKHEKTDARCVL